MELYPRLRQRELPKCFKPLDREVTLDNPVRAGVAEALEESQYNRCTNGFKQRMPVAMRKLKPK